MAKILLIDDEELIMESDMSLYAPICNSNQWSR